MRTLDGGLAALLAGVSMLACGGQAVAQSAPAQPGGTLEEIVVTAQRREENLQTVPIAVSTLTASKIADVGVMSSDALTAVAPGLVVTRRALGAVPYLRGVGSQNTAAGAESSVALYVDGVYHMSPVANIFSFNNIERVEVLKGPQGTLFGRNASGGAINIITRDPSSTEGGSINLSYGAYDTFEGAGYITGGNDKVAADLAVYTIHQGKGFGHYIFAGGDANRQRETAIRSKLAFQFTDDDKLVLSADYATDKSDLGATRNAIPGAILVGGYTFSGNPYDSRANLKTRRKTDYHLGGSANYEHQMDWGTFSSLTAFRTLRLDYFYDQDATPAPLANIHIRQLEQTFQQEFLLVGSADRVTWTAGAFFFHALSKMDPLMVNTATVISTAQNTTSYAGFAQLGYALTDTTKLTAGARYTRDHRDFHGVNVATSGPAIGTPTSGSRSSAKFPKLTYRFAIDQKLRDSVLVYASYSRGYKSGEYNLTSATAPFVRPETLDAAELGLKSEWLDHTVRLNAALFHYNYKDIQLYSVQSGTSTLLNAASGRLNGGDVELTIAPPIETGRLEITSGLSVLHARYRKFPAGVLTAQNPTGGDTQVVADLSGNTMAVSPKWTFQAGVDYAVPIGSGELALSANYYHNAGFFWDYGNRLKQKAYDVVNGQVAYAFGPDHRYRVRVWAKNLFDERYYIYVQEGTLGDLGSAAPPRTYGVGLDAKF